MTFLMIAGILPGALYTFITWQSTTATVRQSIGVSFRQAAINNASLLSGAIENEIVEADLLSHSASLGRLLTAEDLSHESNRYNYSTRHLSYFTKTRKDKYFQILLTNTAGKIISSAGAGIGANSLAAEKWWRQTIDSGLPFVGNLRKEPGAGKYVLNVAVPIKEEGLTVGVFVLRVTLDALLEDIAKQRVGNRGHIDIFDSTGRLILDKGRLMREKMPAGLLDELAQDKPNWHVARDKHGTLALIGAAPVMFSKRFNSDIFSTTRGWYIMIPQGLLEAYRPLLVLMLQVFSLGVVAVAGIFITGYYRAGQIVKPLKKLRDGARELARGNLDFHVDLSTNDEMEEVADEFNRMAVALKASEHHLRTANDGLEHASRLKSEFLANMSHELRTPLNSIIGFAEVMADQLFGPLNEKQTKYINNIHTSGHHLLQLINDILDLSKIEAGKTELNYHRFEAAKALDEAYLSLKPLANKKELSMEMQVDPDLETIAADEAKFKQIMYNLLSNAIKFTPVQGRIFIEARNNDGLAVIAVKDSGIGISARDQELIFEQFRQVSGSDSREFEGTGLGLALTRKLVELHGGQILVESELGQGSKFTFTIPVDMPDNLLEAADATLVCRIDQGPDSTSTTIIDDETSSPAPIAKSITPAYRPRPTKRPAILIVDDDPKATELISIFVRDSDYEVLIAGDGEEAVKMARESLPFAIILDIMLPKKDGWEVLQELKASPLTKDIPVIICSMVDDHKRGMSLGAANHLTKPIKKHELLDLLTKCRKSRGGDNQPYVVLIVDDDPNAVELLTAILEPEGFGVIKAFGGEDAIRKASELRPDLMILDLMMPKVNGFDVIQTLNHTHVTDELPIIVLTAKELTADDRQLLNRDIDRVMQKAKFRREDLLKEIHKLERLDPHKAMLIDMETGLFNYRFFKKRLVEETHRAERYRRAFSVMLIEIVNLSDLTHRATEINGTSVLKDIARLLEQNIRGADPVARYTQNQFGIILPETTAVGALKVSGKIAEILTRYEALSISDSKVTALEINVSSATFFEDATDTQSLIDKAEAGLLKTRNS